VDGDCSVPAGAGKGGVIRSAMLEIILNGAAVRLDAPLTVAALLELRGLGGKRVAVERNGEIVPRSQHGEVVLAAGDRLEIVVAVGGG